MIWLERPREPWEQAGASSVPWTGRRFLRQAVLRLLVRCSSQILAIGSAARQTYCRLGAPAHRLRVLPYCCNTRQFAQVETDAVQRILEAYRLNDKTVFLFSGQMIERKGVAVLLEAFSCLARQRPDVVLVLLGDGPLREHYERQTPVELRDRVHFVGWRPQSELPAFFHAADVFVFPSRHDGWGVVIHEACAAGLPIIVSRQTGAAQDLVVEEKSGFLLDRDDVNGFCEKMRWFAEDRQRILQFGEQSRAMAEQFSLDQGARLFREAVAGATASGP
jgi:glycosyltransferase involved in cell wall biosynthesis